MAAVPFAFAIAALIKNDYKEWVKQAFPWMLAGTMVLGLAIMLGGYWAYGISDGEDTGAGIPLRIQVLYLG
jgi:cytochrome c biogenesis factor